MKIGFTGSRNIRKFNEEILQVLDKIKRDDIIIHGGAIGADNLIKEYCNINNIAQEIIRPVNPSNKSHYLYRNIEIITKCNKLIVFWDGESRGTKFTMEYANARNKEIVIVKQKEEKMNKPKLKEFLKKYLKPSDENALAQFEKELEEIFY